MRAQEILSMTLEEIADFIDSRLENPHEHPSGASWITINTKVAEFMAERLGQFYQEQTS